MDPSLQKSQTNPTQSKSQKKRAKRKRSQNSNNPASKKQKTDLELEYEAKLFGDSDIVDDTQPETEGDAEKGDTAIDVQPAWHDDDDDKVAKGSVGNTSINEELRRKRASLGETPSWAVLTSANSDDHDLLNYVSTSVVQSNDRNIIYPGKLRMVNVPDANTDDRPPAGASIVNLEYNNPKTHSLMLTYSKDRILRIFDTSTSSSKNNGSKRRNKKLQSVSLSSANSHFCKFTHDGEEIICGGSRTKKFYTYNLNDGVIQTVSTLESGRGGESDWYQVEKCSVSKDNSYIALLTGGSTSSKKFVKLITRNTKQFICNFETGNPITSMSFSDDSSYLYTGCSNGDVFIWDLASRRCFNRYKDYGSLNTTAIANSPLGVYQATGSSSGVVNIYKMNNNNGLIESFDTSTTTTSTATSSPFSSSPKPFKELLNLTTPISCIKFNHDNQILAYSSDQNQDAVRLVHLPSGTIFKNFPESEWGKRVVCIDFSPDSTNLSFGISNGRVVTYSLLEFVKENKKKQKKKQ
eukprot:TRINITY_DN10344_c0_g1_i1.p1 TRINITY_DN10344_c0_g1~~TRINITY_DN10344_c0_g1_i1.p1  ORF type:complete len:522 (-),score=157.29 TRINITY_DN10344_c0_g1_i1:34-1599(-)